MAARKRNRYEDKHLKNPAFLEKYFHKKVVWLSTVVIITPLVLWSIFIAILDLFGIQDDPDFNFTTDLSLLVGCVFMVYFITDEYRFYQKEIWGKKGYTRSPCEVCGYLTFAEDERGRFFICPVCAWEDDEFHDDPNEPCDGPNGDLSLNDARKNYRLFGACKKHMIKHVRKPKPEEIPVT